MHSLLSGVVYFTVLSGVILTKPFLHYGRCKTEKIELGYWLKPSACEYRREATGSTTSIPDEGYTLNDLICCPATLASATIDIDVRIGADLRTNSVLPEPPNCGLMLTNRIYGGNTTTIDEHPWMALLEYSTPNGNGHHCGGSLINERWVLTAAHCTTGRGLSPGWRVIAARLGEWNTASDPDCTVDGSGNEECAPSHVDVPIDRILPHPDFDSYQANVPNDIALLRLERPVRRTLFVKPICLPLDSYVGEHALVQSVAEVAGWGRTEHGDQHSEVKRKAALKLWPLKECRQLYRNNGLNLDERQLCAGGEEGIDSCRGDSGGPLMLELRSPKHRLKANYQIALVSIGKVRCGSKGFPGIYTMIAPYIDWIRRTIEDNS